MAYTSNLSAKVHTYNSNKEKNSSLRSNSSSFSNQSPDLFSRLIVSLLHTNSQNECLEPNDDQSFLSTSSDCDSLEEQENGEEETKECSCITNSNNKKNKNNKNNKKVINNNIKKSDISNNTNTSLNYYYDFECDFPGVSGLPVPQDYLLIQEQLKSESKRNSSENLIAKVEQNTDKLNFDHLEKHTQNIDIVPNKNSEINNTNTLKKISNFFSRANLSPRIFNSFHNYNSSFKKDTFSWSVSGSPPNDMATRNSLESLSTSRSSTDDLEDIEKVAQHVLDFTNSDTFPIAQSSSCACESHADSHFSISPSSLDTQLNQLDLKINKDISKNNNKNNNIENDDNDEFEFLNDQNEPLTENQLRDRIRQIQQADISERVKAKKMQKLLSYRYYKLKAAKQDEKSNILLNNLSSNSNETISIRETLVPTYHDEENLLFGCAHYQRAAKLQCSQCSQFHTCPFCHDDKIKDHHMNRKETSQMMCMYCKNIQKVGAECNSCGERLARYYCEKCNIWENDPDKSIYHCPDCGICRVGIGLGKDFFHCKTCNICMDISLEGSHRCIEHAAECDCPICGEFLFTSTETVVFMLCGHAIHQNCYYEHIRRSYKCPTCARSVLNMENQFRLMDREISRQVLPDPYSNWRSVIVCNDCSGKSFVPFHFLGLRCDTCRSYNTCQIKLIKPEEGNEFSSTPPIQSGSAPSSNLNNIERIEEINTTNEMNNENESVSNVAINEVQATLLETHSPQESTREQTHFNNLQTTDEPYQLLQTDIDRAVVEYNETEDVSAESDTKAKNSSKSLKQLENSGSSSKNNSQRSRAASVSSVHSSEEAENNIVSMPEISFTSRLNLLPFDINDIGGYIT